MLSVSALWPPTMSAYPYAPPASHFPAMEAPTVIPRWHGGAIFAALPLLLMVFFQVEHMYDKGWALTLSRFEPILFLFPVCIVMFGAGFAMAQRCATAAKMEIGVLSLCFGMAASALMLAIFNLYRASMGETLFSFASQANIFGRVCLLMCPIGLFSCTGVVWHAKRWQRRRGGSKALQQ